MNMTTKLTYVSKQAVPANTEITNTTYWGRVSPNNAAIDKNTQDIATNTTNIATNTTNIATNTTNITKDESNIDNILTTLYTPTDNS